MKTSSQEQSSDGNKVVVVLPQARMLDTAPMSENRSQSEQIPMATKDLEELGIATDTDIHQTPLRLPLVLTLAGATFLNTLSVQSVVIILPSVGRDVGIPVSRQQWVVSAYYLTYGCFLLLLGRLADMYGRREVFILGCVWIVIATTIVPFISNEIGFDIFRGLQGLGAAATMPTAIGILGATYPPGKTKNYAFAIYSAGSSLGSVLGNIFGGVIGEYAGWKWVFWIIAILAALVGTFAHFLIPITNAWFTRPDEAELDIDWIGSALVTIGIVLLIFALTEGNIVGWSTWWVIMVLILSIALVGVFLSWQWFIEHRLKRTPLIRLSIWRYGSFTAAQVIMATFFAAFNNYLVFATYFYQDYLGLSVIQTTLRFIPTGVVGFLASFLVAKALSCISGHVILIFSTICVSISCLLMAVPIDPSTSYWAYGFPAMCLSTLGADMLFPALTLYTSQALPKQDQALAGALSTAVLQIGRAVGLAIATATQTVVEKAQLHDGSTNLPNDQKGNTAFLQGLRAAEYFNFGLSATACLVAALAFRSRGNIGSPN